jgi:hypothetical protein
MAHPPNPSLGEFHGYYNITKRDYRKFAINDDYVHRVLTTCDDVPPLRRSEDRYVKSCIGSMLNTAGIGQVDFITHIGYLWPSDYFAIDLDIFDRSTNVWLSSSQWIRTSAVVQSIQSFLAKDAPLWRVFLRLPAGDAPEIVIYPTAIRLGDGVWMSQDSLESFCDSLMAPEKEHLYLFTKQFQNVNNGLPISNEDQNAALMKHFTWRISDGSESGHTIWIVSETLTVKELTVDQCTYIPKSTSIDGRLDNGVWRMTSREQSNSRCFIVETMPIPHGVTEVGGNGYDDEYNSREFRLRVEQR